jgi:CRP/FNR family transcriptional regulator, cyclic AMP receptor protein
MTATRATIRERTVRLLEHDPDLGRTLRPERLEEARESARAGAVRIAAGPWSPPELARAHDCPYGLLILGGLASRTVVLGDVIASQLIGRGDLVHLRDESAAEALVPTDVRWTALEPLSVALLDTRFLLAVRRWPEIVAALFERVAAQAERQATHRALCHLPRVEDRVHALLWFLAERWGRVTPQGVLLPLHLTHGMLGQLVAAKRPTVSLAIKELEARGSVHRRSDGAWLLEQAWAPAGAAPEDFANGGGAFLEPQPAIGASVAAAGPQRNGEENRLGDLRRHVERLRDTHARAVGDVERLLARSAAAQEQAVQLRERLARERARQPHP